MGAPTKSITMSSSSSDLQTKQQQQQQPSGSTKAGLRHFFLRRSTPPPSSSTTTNTSFSTIEPFTTTTKYEPMREATETRRQQQSTTSASPVATTRKKGGMFWSGNSKNNKDAQNVNHNTTSISTVEAQQHGLRSPSSGNSSSENLEVVLSKFANHFNDTKNNNNTDYSDVTERISSIRPIGQKSPLPSIIKPIVIPPTSIGAFGTTTARTTTTTSNNNMGIVDIATERPPDKSGTALELDEMSASQQQQQKQIVKERDGFCRHVDKYDGSVIFVEGQAAYELGNYLGGGVAGVVYEGNRLLPESEYPVRRGLEPPAPSVINTYINFENDVSGRVNSLFSCVPAAATMCHTDVTADHPQQTFDICVDNTNTTLPGGGGAPAKLPPDLNKNTSFMIRDNGSILTADTNATDRTMNTLTMTETVALEAVDNMILIDEQDAPSRSKHLAQAVRAQTGKNNMDGDFPSDASFTNGFMEETVAIKILNPVGFRALSVDVTNTAVVARRGLPYQPINPMTGMKNSMEEKHVWWIINPSSRNLRTLQRYSANTASLPRGVEVDRGSAEKGLRISVIAAYQDPMSKQIKELPLTKCIEIWGHVPFDTSDAEFRDVMLAIENINQGLPPPIDIVPGRVGTGTSSLSSFTNPNNVSADSLFTPTAMTTQRT
jgi:hypothetical protein